MWVQGVACYNGNLFLTADDGNAGMDRPDHLYRLSADPKADTAEVYMERTFDDVKMQGEIEGLTFDEKEKGCSCSTTGEPGYRLVCPKGSMTDTNVRYRKCSRTI